MAIKIKRVYEPYEASDGYRILVDRLWPRGISKEKGHIDIWLKEVAPSTELRKWFHHEPEKWEAFVKKYAAELKDNNALEELIALTRKHKVTTFLYSAKDEQNNQAVVLKQFVSDAGK